MGLETGQPTAKENSFYSCWPLGSGTAELCLPVLVVVRDAGVCSELSGVTGEQLGFQVLMPPRSRKEAFVGTELLGKARRACAL